jgi:protein phosphatase
MKSTAFDAAVGCHIGNIRANNEDNFYFGGMHLCKENRDAPFFRNFSADDALQFYAVFDGMGGEEHGETAALVAAETLAKYHALLRTIRYHDFDKYIDMFLSEANNRIRDAAGELGARRMGSTIALLCVADGRRHVYNVGDSRIYKFSKKRLTQISEDHTPAFRAVRMGVMSKEAAKNHPHRNKLTQYLGIAEEEMIVKPFRASLRAKRGDDFLLCSDGLTDMLEDDAIAEILRGADSSATAVRALVDAALQKGGRDNICVILLKALA